MAEKKLKTRNTLEKGAKKVKRRLAPLEREEQILATSIRFFAENGFDAKLRDLAQAMNIAPSLVLNYFGSKEKLIEKVYERVFIARWNVYWVSILNDRSRTLSDRLEEFYNSYLAAVDDYDWMRIAVISGLRGDDLIGRYLERVVSDIIETIAEELRIVHEDHEPPLTHVDFKEISWSLHGSFIYLLMRRYVFQTDATMDNKRFTKTIVAQFFDGMQDAEIETDKRTK